MATLKFILRSEAENTPIYLRFSIQRGKILYRKTGLIINPSEWSSKTGTPKQTTASNKNISSQLRKLETFVVDAFNLSTGDVDEIKGEWLQYQINLFFNRITENNKSDLLTDAIQGIIDSADLRKNGKGGAGLSKSRVGAYNGLKKTVAEYEGIKPIRVKDVNIQFGKDFLKYLLNTKNYQKSYAYKKVSDLKTACYDAELNGVEVNIQFKKIFCPNTSNENIIYLSPLELDKIESLGTLSDGLKKARKWLLFGCNVGQRGSDLLNIDANNFVNRGGLDFVELQQKKGNKNVVIPVLPVTEKIIKEGLPYKISIQKFTEHLKTLCKLAGIDEVIKGRLIDSNTMRKIDGHYPKWQLIGSHVCRRSFASNYYIRIKTPLLMHITGHSTEKMFLNYIGKDPIDYAQQMLSDMKDLLQKEKKEPHLTIVKNASNE